MDRVGGQRSKGEFVTNEPITAGAGQLDNYVSMFTTYGNLRKKSGGRRLEAGELVIDSTHEYTCRFAESLEDGLNNSVKVIISGKTYTINDWWKEDEKNFYYKFALNKSEEQLTLSPGGPGGELVWTLKEW